MIKRFGKDDIVEIAKLVDMFTIHKPIGEEVSNCLYIEKSDQIPDFLIDDGAIEVNEDMTITLYEIDRSETISLPAYIRWEKVSKLHEAKVPGKYRTWFRKDGSRLTVGRKGECYKAPAVIEACLVGEVIPEWLIRAGMPVTRIGDSWELVRYMYFAGRIYVTTKTGKIGEAMWLKYENGEVGIAKIVETPPREIFPWYDIDLHIQKYIMNVDGIDIGAIFLY